MNWFQRWLNGSGKYVIAAFCVGIMSFNGHDPIIPPAILNAFMSIIGMLIPSIAPIITKEPKKEK